MARSTKQLDRWRKSTAFRQIARKSARKNLKLLGQRPKCGAKRRRDGQPCTNPAMKNGRCAIHGGKTPSGRQWHVVQYADCSTPAGEVKFSRKLRQQKRYAAKRAARLAAMTPEELARHKAWHRTHRPGLFAAVRSADREQVRQNAEARALFNQAPSSRPLNPEAERVDAALAAARAELARLEAKAGRSSNENEGIFS